MGMVVRPTVCMCLDTKLPALYLFANAIKAKFGSISIGSIGRVGQNYVLTCTYSLKGEIAKWQFEAIAFPSCHIILPPSPLKPVPQNNPNIITSWSHQQFPGGNNGGVFPNILHSGTTRINNVIFSPCVFGVASIFFTLLLGCCVIVP